jgi:hypothetical protein
MPPARGKHPTDLSANITPSKTELVLSTCDNVVISTMLVERSGHFSNLSSPLRNDHVLRLMTVLSSSELGKTLRTIHVTGSAGFDRC